jgi:hypothetical protein
MSIPRLAAILGVWLLWGWPHVAVAGTSQPRVTLVGVFIGCTTGQGLTECRVLGQDGKDYLVSANLGCGLAAGNATEDLVETLDADAWKGKTVAIEASLAPDGSIAEVHALRLAPDQPATAIPPMRVNVVRTGVIDQTDEGFTLRTAETLYALVPGKAYRFGDLAMLMHKKDGTPVTLRGDILTDRGKPLFVVTAMEP